MRKIYTEEILQRKEIQQAPVQNWILDKKSLTLRSLYLLICMKNEQRCDECINLFRIVGILVIIQKKIIYSGINSQKQKATSTMIF